MCLLLSVLVSSKEYFGNGAAYVVRPLTRLFKVNEVGSRLVLVFHACQLCFGSLRCPALQHAL